MNTAEHTPNPETVKLNEPYYQLVRDKMNEIIDFITNNTLPPPRFDDLDSSNFNEDGQKFIMLAVMMQYLAEGAGTFANMGALGGLMYSNDDIKDKKKWSDVLSMMERINAEVKAHQEKGE